MVNVEKSFCKNYGLHGKIFKEEKIQHKCSILQSQQINQNIYHYEVM